MCGSVFLREEISGPDLPPLNEAIFGARIRGGRKQGRANHATREDGADGGGDSEAPGVEVEVGRGKTGVEAVKKIGVTEQTYSAKPE